MSSSESNTASAVALPPVQSGKVKKPRTEKQMEAFKKCLQTRLNKIDERKKLAAAQVQAAQELTKAAVEGTLMNSEVTAKIMRPFQDAVLAQPTAVEKAASRRVRKLVSEQRAQQAAATQALQTQSPQTPTMEVDDAENEPEYDAQNELALAIESKQRELQSMMQSLHGTEPLQSIQRPPSSRSVKSSRPLSSMPPPPPQPDPSLSEEVPPSSRQRTRSSRNPDAAMQRAMARMPRATLPKRSREEFEQQTAYTLDNDDNDDDEAGVMQPDFDIQNYGPSIQQLQFHPAYLQQLQASMERQAYTKSQGQKKKSVTSSDYQQRLFAASLGF